MRLLVAPHDLGIGGSQRNAIDLAAAAAEAGHDVVVYGVPGPLEDYIKARGLDWVPARRLRYRPAPSRIAQIAALARRHRIDLIHAYEWPPCQEAYYGAHLALGVPLLCTVLSMSVSPLVPSSIPLIMGTEALGEEARRTHRAPVWVLEPPIDSDADHPGIDSREFRRAYGIDEDALLVVTVSRLAIELKLDALVRAIDAVGEIARERPVQLVVVGGGPAAKALQSRVDGVNDRCSRDAIQLVGPIADPRSAYAAADLVVGMGSSALRAMSIGRPVVVQGEHAFSLPFEPGTLDHFMRHGFWGTGDGVSSLAGQLRTLIDDPARRAQLGAFGRRTVEERFSLGRAAAVQLEIYDEVLGLARKARAGAVAAAARALQVELQAHDPRRKRARRQSEQSLLRWASGPAQYGANV